MDYIVALIAAVAVVLITLGLGWRDEGEVDADAISRRLAALAG